jgi:hypothetical protein
MSYAPQGPDWKQAPDGRWYPPAPPPPPTVVAPRVVHTTVRVRRTNWGALVALAFCLMLPVVAVVAIAALGAASGGGVSTPGTTHRAVASEASAVVTECDVRGASGATAAGTVTNSTGISHDYDLVVQFTRPDGVTVLAAAPVTIAGVRPGVPRAWRVDAVEALPDETLCIVGPLTVTQ